MADVVYDAILGQSSGSNVYLRQVISSDFQPNREWLEGRNSGAPTMATVGTSPVLAATFLDSEQPVAPLSTMDIAGFLGSFGAAGSLIADGSLVQIPFQKRAAGGTFVGGSSNFIVKGQLNTATSDSSFCPALLVPMSINAPRKGPVTASGEVHFFSGDGLTSSYQTAVNQALSAQAFNAMFALGPVFVNGARIQKNVGVSVNFGLRYSEKQFYDGLPYPITMFLEEISPSIDIQFEDFDQINSFGVGQQLTSFSVYFRKRLPGSTFVADATAQHIKLSFANGQTTPEALRAQDTHHGNAALRVRGVSLSISTASAVGTS